MMTANHLEVIETPLLRDILAAAVRDFAPGCVVETGTHRGTGTTRAIYNAVKVLNIPFHTIEVSESLARAAAANLVGTGVIVHNGLSIRSAAAIEATKHHPIFGDGRAVPGNIRCDSLDPVSMYLAEIEGAMGGGNAVAVPGGLLDELLVHGGLRDMRPLICLDSAGSLGWLEFQEVLRLMDGRPFLLFLDDIDHVKHYLSRKFIEAGNGFWIVGMDEAAGWMIAERYARAECAPRTEAPDAARNSYSDIAQFLCSVAQPKPQDANAERVYRWALELEPECADAFEGLGRAAMARGENRIALNYLQIAARKRPDVAHYLINLAIAEARLEQIEDAERHLLEALRLNPEATNAHMALSTIYGHREQYAEAVKILDAAIAIQPDSPDLHWARAQARLLVRDWKGGWEDWEWRESRRGLLNELRGHAEWDGSPIPGKTLLIIGEHGIGDQIMFSRWLPIAWHRSRATIHFRTVPGLVRLLDSGAQRVIGRDEDIGEFDYWVALSSLPAVTGRHEPPAPLWMPVDRRQSGGMMKVGICWHGDPRTPVDSMRPRDFELWRSLLDTPGVQFVSLQLGENPDRRLAPLAAADMMDTAEVIAGLDLVITADTAIAHLAGSLDVPTWMLLYRPPEWRWETEGERTVWYPSMGIFRQDENRTWGTVFERVMEWLASAAHSPALTILPKIPINRESIWQFS